jgi:hypothetical protein
MKAKKKKCGSCHRHRTQVFTHTYTNTGSQAFINSCSGGGIIDVFIYSCNVFPCSLNILTISKYYFGCKENKANKQFSSKRQP